MPVIVVTDASFEVEVLRSELPVLVELYADWCEPCKQLSPIVEQIASQLEGKLKVVKVDVEQNLMVAQAFRAQSIPMLLVIQDGKVAQKHVGTFDKAELERFIEPFLPRSVGEIKSKELATWISQGKALPIDIRDAHAYQRHHIPTAIHMPADTLMDHIEKLQPFDGRTRVLYARSGEAQRMGRTIDGSGSASSIPVRRLFVLGSRQLGG